MKHLLLTTIAAVLVVGCGESQQSAPAPETKPKPPTVKAPDISIHDAAFKGNSEVVKQYLVSGADVNEKDNDGATPLDWAISRDHRVTADLLCKHGGKHGTIHGAAYGGDIEAVKEFLAAGTDVNAKGEFGETPLHFAETREIAELLIAKGADVNAKSNRGETPLHLAAYNGHKEIVVLLIDASANVNAQDVLGSNKGNTPLNAASEENHPEVADILRKHGGKTGEELKAEGK